MAKEKDPLEELALDATDSIFDEGIVKDELEFDKPSRRLVKNVIWDALSKAFDAGYDQALEDTAEQNAGAGL